MIAQGAEFGAEEVEEPAASQASKKSSKKKKAKDSRSPGVANASEALGLDEEGSPADAEEDSAALSKREESAAGTADAAEQEEVAAVKPKGKKKKGKVDIGRAFAALGLEDDADSTVANMNGDSHGSDTAYSKANGHAAATEEIAAVDHANPEPESMKLNGAATLATLAGAKQWFPDVSDRRFFRLDVCSASLTLSEMLQVRRGRERSPAPMSMLCWHPWAKRQPALLSKRWMVSLLRRQQPVSRKRQRRRRRTGSMVAKWMLCWHS